jgi:hypothetical protein
MRALVLATLLLTACGVQTRDPDITGQVTQISESANGRLLVMVEDRPGDPIGKKVSVTVDRGTRVFRDSAQGRLDAQPGDLAMATVVSVWMVGPITTSYPGQGSAETLLIRAGRAAPVPLPSRPVPRPSRIP